MTIQQDEPPLGGSPGAESFLSKVIFRHRREENSRPMQRSAPHGGEPFSLYAAEVGPMSAASGPPKTAHQEDDDRDQQNQTEGAASDRGPADKKATAAEQQEKHNKENEKVHAG